MTLWQEPLYTLVAATRNGDLSASELTKTFIDRIIEIDPAVKAFLDPMIQTAFKRSRELDSIPKEERKALHGLPIAVKDIISVAGTHCTCGSHILKDYTPLYDATVISRLLEAGAVILGKTNMDEFGMGSSTENSRFQTTHNPWDLNCVPGGSSGGSAAAVAARLVPAALGTDTGGSIRQPAAFCGVSGLKPTYGRISRYGLVAFASSLDQIGPLTSSIADTALLLETLSGHDPKDSTSSKQPVPLFTKQLTKKVNGLRIGIPQSATSKGIDNDVRESFTAATKVFEELGVELEEVVLSPSQHSIACYYLLATAEASANLARYDGVRYGHRSTETSDLKTMINQTRYEGFGNEVKRRILLGTFVLSAGYRDAYYQKAQRVRSLIRRDFDKVFEHVDAIFLPTSPTPAFNIGSKTNDPLSMYLSDVFTITANLIGAPALSLPVGFSTEGLPIGAQLIGKYFDETTILTLGHSFQQNSQHHKQLPAIAQV